MTNYKKHAVYISYARNGNERPGWDHIADFVQPLADEINGMGIDCYIDSDDLHNGDSITEFEKAIGNGDYVILVFSERYFTRPHCMYEFMLIKEGVECGRIKKVYYIKSGNYKIDDVNSLSFVYGEWGRLKNEYEIKGIKKTIMEKAKSYGYYCDFIKNDLVDYFISRSYGFKKEKFLDELKRNFININFQENKYNIDWGSGILNCSHQSSAKPGSLIRFEIEERSGYTVDYVNIGSVKVEPTSDNWYSFKMPSNEVNVWAHYIKTKQPSVITVKPAAVIESDPCKIVDLGLSVLWATCNVGANNEWEYGDYFAWGETSPKSIYNWSTYKYANGDYKKLTKYCSKKDYGNKGFTDSRTILESSDDAATANWGSDWCMPTFDQINELKEKCKWTWTTKNGIKGYKVTGPNGNSLFLPAAGFRYGTDLYYVGSFGYYWSRSLYESCPYRASCLYFHSSYVDWLDYHRGSGHTVRPVRCK